jgi:LPS-assembly protein
LPAREKPAILWTPCPPSRIGFVAGERGPSARGVLFVLRQTFLLSAAVVALTAGMSSHAQTPSPTPSATPVPPPAAASKPDVIVHADTIDQDKTSQIVTAQGNVEVRVGTRMLLADKVIYDRDKQTLRAQGNVQITDTTGATEFADEIEVDQDFTNGFATRFSTRMPGKSPGTATASSAVRSDSTRNALDQVIFTTCEVCEAEGTAPTWTLRARHAVQNQDTQMITYQDAVLEVKGVPILYLPYFAHPDPTSERRSGLLVPSVGLSSKLGAFYQQPYYWAISPSQDLTISPMLSSQVNPLLELSYRKRFFSGYVQLAGSVTDEQEFDSHGDKFGDKTWRSHLYGGGLFAINQDWRWGFGVERQSDDLYDRRYDIKGATDRGLFTSQPRQLVSQLFTTGQTESFYAEIAAASVQGLRASDIAAQTPTVAPTIFAEKVYDLGAAGLVSADFSAVSLNRDQRQLLPNGQSAMDSARATASVNWDAQYIAGPGVVVEPFVMGRGDAYRIDDGVPVAPGSSSKAETITRFLGLVGAQVSMPFIKRGKSMDLLIEPIAMVGYGTTDANDPRIPNEDSLLLESDDSNLFKPNSVSNYDLCEGGARASLGLSAKANFGSGVDVTGVVGRRWREEADPTFNDLSNLSEKTSDYVGSMRANFGPTLSTGVRVRYDDNLNFSRIDLDATTRIWRLNGTARYFRIAKNSSGIPDEGIILNGSMKITKNWSAIGLQFRNITDNRDLKLALGVAYEDECSYFTITYERTGSVDRSLAPYSGIRFNFAFKGLGG